MALITCWKCGKKYSDTIDSCIHCGAPIESSASVRDTLLMEDVRIEDVNVKKVEYTDFWDYPEQTRNRLEGEFWAHDKKAAKWRRVEIETKKAWSLVWALILSFCIDFCLVKLLYSNDYSNFFMVSFVCALIGLALAVIISIGLIVAMIFVKCSIKPFLYMKKLQKWLFEEKRIKFVPRFNNAKERAKFEKINLEYMDF